MSGTWITSGVAVATGMLLLAGPARAASDPVAKCAATKVQSAGKKAGAKLKCHAKAIKKAVALDPVCIQKAEDKYAEAFAKIEAKGGCATVGDAPAIEAQVDAFVADAVAALPDGGTPEGAKCASTKVQAAGKKADAKLKCNSKAIGKGLAVDGECITKAEAKFITAYTKAEAKGDCATTGDAAAIEARVDQLVTSVLGSLSGQRVRIAITYNPQNVLDLAGVELTVAYPSAKVAIPGTGNVPEVVARLTNIGPSGNSLNGSDNDTQLRVLYAGTDPTSVPNGDIVRVVFDKVGVAPVAGDFGCTVTLASDSFGLSVPGVGCTITLE